MGAGAAGRATGRAALLPVLVAMFLAACPHDTTLPPVTVEPVAAADPGSSLPADWTDGPFMEIYVRGYQDSDGDGHGDLRGLIQRLDYLAALGVRGLWLMPITKSQDLDHGYAVVDYRDVEGTYGTLDDLRELLAQAHARGIGVILDYVMNHSAAQHPIFLHSSNVRGADFADWFVWREAFPGGWSIYGQNPWYQGRGSRRDFYFAGFWEQMPDWNLEHDEVVRFHHDNLRFWLNLGVDGFRFDAVGNLVEHAADAWENQPENYELMREVARLIGSYQRRFLVCEAPADPVGFASACGAAFAFGQQYDLADAARGQQGAIDKVAGHVRTGTPRLAPFGSNHDTFAGQRLADQVGGDEALLRLAAATYLLHAGTPFLYYGEEVGMAGAAGLSGDHKLRTPMSWTADPGHAGFSSRTPFRELAANSRTHNVAALMNQPGSLWSLYRELLALRRRLPVLARGAAEQVASGDQVLRYRRTLGGASVIVAINYATAPRTISMSGLPASASLSRAFPAGAAGASTSAQGVLSLTLGAREVAVLELP